MIATETIDSLLTIPDPSSYFTTKTGVAELLELLAEVKAARKVNKNLSWLVEVATNVSVRLSSNTPVSADLSAELNEALTGYNRLQLQQMQEDKGIQYAVRGYSVMAGEVQPGWCSGSLNLSPPGFFKASTTMHFDSGPESVRHLMNSAVLVKGRDIYHKGIKIAKITTQTGTYPEGTAELKIVFLVRDVGIC